MNYEEEISALKNTVSELLERDRHREKEYKKITKRYKEVVTTLLRKDEGFQTLVKKQHDHASCMNIFDGRINDFVNKLDELEDILEDMV